jgi:hypothetical protein
VAHPSQDWHERRLVHQPASSRDRIRPSPGARELLTWLSEAGIRWAIAKRPHGNCSRQLAALGVDPDRSPVVTRDQVKYAKPDPDLFLASAERLGAPIETAVVVGDSIGTCWQRYDVVRVGLKWRLWAGRVETIRCVPRLRGSGRSAAPHRRGRRTALKTSMALIAAISDATPEGMTFRPVTNIIPHS